MKIQRLAIFGTGESENHPDDIDVMFFCW